MYADESLNERGFITIVQLQKNLIEDHTGKKPSSKGYNKFGLVVLWLDIIQEKKALFCSKRMDT